MKSFRGEEVGEVGALYPELNVYYAANRYAGLELIVKQPRKEDSGRLRVAWKDASEKSMIQYRRRYVPPSLYDPKFRCSLPLYHGAVPGWLPTVMMVDGKDVDGKGYNGKIVGFGDIVFQFGHDLKQYQIGDEEIGASGNLCILDKHQGLGIGTWYGEISSFIAASFGANWMIGMVQRDGGFLNSRLNQGFVKVGTRGNYTIIKKRLISSGELAPSERVVNKP